MDITERKRIEQEILFVSEGGRTTSHWPALGQLCASVSQDPILGDVLKRDLLFEA
jgi:hypothetical protein